MGIEFRENSLMIAPKTTASVQKGQVYNLCVGLSGLTNKEASNKETKVYALYVGDTVLVNEVCVKYCTNILVLNIFLKIKNVLKCNALKIYFEYLITIFDLCYVIS